MRRLICTFVVRIGQKQVFSWQGSYKDTFISSPEPKAHKVSLLYSKAQSSVVVHTFKQIYLQDQLANFSHILSVASWGGGKAA